MTNLEGVANDVTLSPAVEAGISELTERVLRLGPDETIVGVLTEPRTPDPDVPTLILISAGMVHRVGPNRMHVTLARELARLGVRSLRFDLSGIGDSPTRRDGMPANESAIVETRLAMSALAATCGARSFVLAGLCSGAVTAFQTAVQDDRVIGTVLLNPQAFDHDPDWNAHVQNLTQVRRYMARAKASSSNWRRALTGRIDYRRAVQAIARRAVQATTPRATRSPISVELERQFEALRVRGTRQLVVCCEGDSSVDYMSEILGRDAMRGRESSLDLQVLAATDHSFTTTSAQRELVGRVQRWLDFSSEAVQG